MPTQDTLEIAQVAHEANNILQLALGQVVQPAWADLPEDLRRSTVAGVEFRLSHPEATAQAQHEAWAEHKRIDGWVYGPVKDGAAKTHPCLVPYEELPTAERAKDLLFQLIVDAMK